MKAEKRRYKKPKFMKHKAAALVSGTSSKCAISVSRVKDNIYYF